MKNKYKKYFKEIVLLTASLSNCVKKKVGAILIDDESRILCQAYNGTLKDFKNCCDYKWTSKNITNHHNFAEENEVHSEVNLMAFAAKYGISTKNKILIITLSPCLNCAKLIITSGIKEVWYIEEHKKKDSGLKLLKKAKIKIKKI